jgi:putative sigma-54 modulation protein
MKFEYTGRHIEVTPALRSHVEEHFARISHLFDGGATSAHVIIEVERNRHRSEIIVNWKHDVLTATTIGADMYKSLAQTISKIEKQALRLRKKVIDKHHKAKKASSITARDEVSPSPNGARIISERRYVVKPMTAEEAAMMIDGDSGKFVVFRNADNERVSVIYKRKDGNYGLIQP